MDNKPVKIDEKHWFSNRQVVGIIMSVGIATFYVTLVYAEFTARRTEYQADKKFLLEKIDVLEQRLNKKIKIISENTDEINRLKQKGSDK